MNFDRPGGDITWIRELYSGLSRRGHKMEMYLPIGKGAEYSRGLINRYAYKSPHSSHPPINYVLNQLFRHYSGPKLDFLNDSDIVQVELSMLLPFSRLSNLLEKKNVVFDLHSITAFDLEPFIPRAFRGWILPLLIKMQGKVIRDSTAIAVSHSMKRFIQQQYKIDGENIHVIHPGVNLDYAKEMADQYKEKYRWIRKNADFIVAYVGTLLPVEGVDLLILAMCKIVKQIPRARLVVFGSGPQQRELKELVKTHRIDTNVHFHGWIPYEETFAAQKQADVLACPVKIPNEGTMISSIAFPVKIPQYLASGKPILTTHLGDIPRYIHHEKEGLVLKKPTVDNIADAIIRLAKSDSLRLEMSAASMKTALKLTWDKSVDKLEQVYSGLVS